MVENRHVQKKGSLTKKEANERDTRMLSDELYFLQIVKRVFDSPDGSVFIRRLLNITNPMAQPNEGSKVGFQIGQQSIGRELIAWLSDAGVKLELSDFVSSLNLNRIREIENDLNKLLTEDK